MKPEKIKIGGKYTGASIIVGERKEYRYINSITEKVNCKTVNYDRYGEAGGFTSNNNMLLEGFAAWAQEEVK